MTGAPSQAGREKVLPIVGLAMFTASLTLVGAGYFAGRGRQAPDEIELLAWAAAGWAFACPLAAVALRSRVVGAARRGDGVTDARAWQQGQILYFTVLESGALGCALALFLAGSEWPLLAAALPLAALLAGARQSPPL